jgi:single-strand DNA-binding protein
MFDINEIHLRGKLGRDAETRSTPTGKSVTTLSVATCERRKNVSGAWENGPTTWHKVTVWGAPESIASAAKGTTVQVRGRYESRSWEDKTGAKQVSYEVNAIDAVILADDRPRQDARAPQANKPYGGTPSGAQRGAQKPVTASTFDDSDVPFAFMLLAPIAGYLAQFVGA